MTNEVGTPVEVRFVPSRVEGVAGVTQVSVHPDRLELLSPDGPLTLPFAELARWPKPAGFWHWMHRRGRWPGALPEVGDRYWSSRPRERWFAFPTDPRLVIYMPEDEPADYEVSHFFRIKRVLRRGGFSTWDLA